MIAFFIPLLLNSCAQTVVDPNSKKAIRNEWNGDIVWNQKVFKPHWWDGEYEVDKMFLDDPESQELMRQGESYRSYGSYALWGGTLGAISYLLAADDANLGVYWTIFGVGAFTHLLFESKKSSKVNEAIEGYNKRKGYVIAPYLIREQNKTGYALGYTYTF